MLRRTGRRGPDIPGQIFRENGQRQVPERFIGMLDSRADNPENATPVASVPRILLADDDEVSRQLLGSAMRRMGFEVYTANQGDEALDLIAKTKPDLLVLDFEMPALNG